MPTGMGYKKQESPLFRHHLPISNAGLIISFRENPVAKFLMSLGMSDVFATMNALSTDALHLLELCTK
jgi:hypothetical protein